MPSPTDAAFWRPTSGGVSVAIRVQPRARKPGVGGVIAATDGPRLRIAVTEPPDAGEANRAVCAALARALDVPPSAVAIDAGAGSRLKRLLVSGDPAGLSARLEAL